MEKFKSNDLVICINTGNYVQINKNSIYKVEKNSYWAQNRICIFGINNYMGYPVSYFIKATKIWEKLCIK